MIGKLTNYMNYSANFKKNTINWLGYFVFVLEENWSNEICNLIPRVLSLPTSTKYPGCGWSVTGRFAYESFRLRLALIRLRPICHSPTS